jgi:hypothetical protein
MKCPCKSLVVEIPDLDANQIQGLQCWRADHETSELFDESVRIRFGEFSIGNGTETVEYTMVNAQGESISDLSLAVVLRGEDENDPVRLHFIFGAWNGPPGWIRVSTFNEVGESDLSEEMVFL